MEEIEFTVSQRPWLLGWSLACLAAAACAVLDLVSGADFIRGDARAMMISFGAIGGLPLLEAALGKTVMTANTLTTRSIFYRRSCELNKIIRVTLRVGRGRGYSAWIVVHLSEGKPITLRAPLSTSPKDNSALEDKMNVIRDRVSRVSHHRPR